MQTEFCLPSGTGNGSALEVSVFLLLLKILFCKNGEDYAVQFALCRTDIFFCSSVVLSSHLKMFSVLSCVKYLNLSAKLCVSCIFLSVIQDIC